MNAENLPIYLNGVQTEVPPGTTLLTLLEQRNLSTHRAVAERNELPVKRDAWDATRLEAGDRIEVLQIAAGG
jgi:thiamine biosynthesis protein ThiS